MNRGTAVLIGGLVGAIVLASLAAWLVTSATPPAAKPAQKMTYYLAEPGADTLDALTPEEREAKKSDVMNGHNLDIALAVTGTAEADERTKDLPPWVWRQYSDFMQKSQTKERKGFQRSFGWGTAKPQDETFYWFGHTNVDGWLVFSYSERLDEKLVAEARKQDRERPWELHVEENMQPDVYGYVLPFTKSWMGTTNDWINHYCTLPRYELCDTAGVLEEVVAKINAGLPLHMVVRGRFPWVPKEELNRPKAQ